MKYPVNNLIIFDLEIYPNYFLFGAMMPDGKVFQFTQNNLEELRKLPQWLEANGYTLCGYNSSRYDDVVLSEFLRVGTARQAYVTSLQIIEHDLKRWNMVHPCTIDSIDLMPIIPGWHSLKKLGVSLGHKKLQELPFDPHMELDPEQQGIVARYNINDLEVTAKLLHELQPELDLRSAMSERYQVDLRSRGDAQIAERVLCKSAGIYAKQLNELARTRVTMRPVVNIKPPSWWGEINMMQTENLCEVYNVGNEIFNTPLALNNYQFPKKTLSRIVYMGDRYYQMGVGGLHSIDGPGCWKPGPNETMSDWDVGAMYPSIILREKLEPDQWQGKFLPVYEPIVKERLAAKHAGDKTTDATLKIVINGSFGKFGDQYSALFDPSMLAHVTVYGQLSLLLLIALLDDAGHRVVSANTDGVTVISPRTISDSVIPDWERVTGLVLEETPYQALYQQNVNNYLAIKTDGAWKAKGALLPERDLKHSPNADVCARAVCEYLQHGTDINDWIRSEMDINQFLLTTQVRGAWDVTWGAEPLGKMVRFYKSNREDCPPIIRTPRNDTVKGNQGQLPDSANGVPVPDLPDGFPFDLDYQWYFDRTLMMLTEIMRPKQAGWNAYAKSLYDKGFNLVVTELDRKSLSRHRSAEGTVDFDSMRNDQVIAVSTGKKVGVMGKQYDALSPNMGCEFTKVTGDYPSKTRAKIMKEFDFELIYNANIPLTMDPEIVGEWDDLDQYYTEAELKKVRS